MELESLDIKCVKNITIADSPEPWGLFFQDNATPQMEGLEELHNNIMFYLAIILFSVTWIMISTVLQFRHKTTRISNESGNNDTFVGGIWIITPALILILIAFLSFKYLYLMDEVNWLFMDSPYSESNHSLSDVASRGTSGGEPRCVHGCYHPMAHFHSHHMAEMCSICDAPYPTDKCNSCDCIFHRACQYRGRSYTPTPTGSGAPSPFDTTGSESDYNYAESYESPSNVGKEQEESQSNVEKQQEESKFSSKRKRSDEDDHYNNGRPSKRPRNR